MQFNVNTIALLAALLPLAAAAPADGAADANLVKRQRQYQCTTQPSHMLGECQSAIGRLRGHEARGCDVWGCIGAFAAVIPACGAAVDEFFLNPLADVACIGAVANFQGPCQGCEPF